MIHFDEPSKPEIPMQLRTIKSEIEDDDEASLVFDNDQRMPFKQKNLNPKNFVSMSATSSACQSNRE